MLLPRTVFVSRNDEELPNTKIPKCKVHNIAENNLNRTTSELDLCILVTHYWNFSKSKGHNSA